MTDKELNRKIHSLLGLETRYSIHAVGNELAWDLSLKEANMFVEEYYKENGLETFLSITSESPELYSSCFEYALPAAKELADKHNFTFVLTYNKNERWRAAFGDYKNCEEVEDVSPARATCLAVIKFMETL